MRLSYNAFATTLTLVSLLGGSDAFVARPSLSSSKLQMATIDETTASETSYFAPQLPTVEPKVNVEGMPNVEDDLDDDETNPYASKKISFMDKLKMLIAEAETAKLNKKNSPEFDAIVKSKFPNALTNKELLTKVTEVLSKKGFTPENTLLATSLCCDELARALEDDFVRVYGDNFFLGGLSGFPFAGNTGFGAMAAHIPDDGYSIIIYGPHVGISQTGVVGKVERKGIELLDNCCGSAIAASNYLKSITDGGASLNISSVKQFTDFQQGVVQELILPYGKRLADAGKPPASASADIEGEGTEAVEFDNHEARMLELPYALYESQDLLMRKIVGTGVQRLKKGTVLLGGVQINTGPDTQDYFHPLRFDFIDGNTGNEADVQDMLKML